MSTYSSDQALASGLNWLKSMRRHDGYGGPVVHYWGNSLQYTGSRSDWSIEGLIATFIALDRKTKNSQWLERARWLGEKVIQSQQKNGAYLMSNFEGTPAFWKAAQPHECGVNNGLLMLAERLRELNDLAAEKFIIAAEKNVSNILLPCFWNEKAGTFQQYPLGQFDAAPNLFVPNKIATACESLIRLTELVGKKHYLEYAQQASNAILDHQSQEKLTQGGIFQANNRENIITFYTARCVRPLRLLGKMTKDPAYTRAARKAISFVASMQLSSGAFHFGIDSSGEIIHFPRFVAGNGEVLSALRTDESFDSIYSRGLAWVLSHQHQNGGFPSFEGLRQKNSCDSFLQGESWMDALPVVGWNDKILRLLAEESKALDMVLPPNVNEWEKQCVDGTISENQYSITVRGPRNYTFQKKARFSTSGFNPVKNIFFEVAVQQKPVVSDLAALGFRFVVRW
ncbi:MAG: hypothetical protein IPJ89_02835 [Candidatus Iainarchaeum archaeon]|uniref:Uncharacterized protein n=1 Tax=Candidatus Iainarchaeum sp. TaxID=3101447 RepID=A0A7T9DKS1_9ARCH|nr:MAG: hypothetical protein IPJ89_02835 [Candidatus Diapherotrites archaeon]